MIKKDLLLKNILKKRIINKNFIKGIGITTSPPLNNIIDLLKINNKNKKDFSIFTKIKQSYRDKGIIWTISATESLKIIIRYLKNRIGRKPLIGFPTYFCNEVLESIEDLCIMNFYDITNTTSLFITKLLY